MQLWFSAQNDAVIGYVEYSGIRVVAGAPVCSEQRLKAVIDEFESASRSVCYFGAESRLRRILDASESHFCLSIGAQPVLNPQQWLFTLSRKASLRAQINRAKNKVVSVKEYSTHVPLELDLTPCLNEWLQSRRAETLHFLVEPEVLALLPGRRLFVSQRNNAVVGFLIAAPIPQRNGWLIEHVIRGSQAPNGTNEQLLDAAMNTFYKEGYTHVTLGLIPLLHLESTTPLWARIVYRWMRLLGSWAYNVQGLDYFKSKMQPAYWEPVEMIVNAPKVSLLHFYAVGQAFTQKALLSFVLKSAIKHLSNRLGFKQRWLSLKTLH